MPKSCKILEIPMDGEYKLEVLYLNRHPLIEEFIERHAIKNVLVEL